MNGNTKCKHCGADYSLHRANTYRCPEGGLEALPGSSQRWAETFFYPMDNFDNRYVEAIAKIADSMSFLVRELQDAHGAAPNVGTQIVLMDYLEKIVKIKTDVNRLKDETKGP